MTAQLAKQGHHHLGKYTSTPEDLVNSTEGYTTADIKSRGTTLVMKD
jgi:hypothetical protein